MKTVPQSTEQVLMQRLNTIQKRRINETGNELENSTLLGSRRERVSLLKAGFESKDIESLYLELNGFIVTGVNWRE